MSICLPQVTFDVQEEAVSIYQQDSVVKNDIGESVGGSGGIAVKTD